MNRWKTIADKMAFALLATPRSDFENRVCLGARARAFGGDGFVRVLDESMTFEDLEVIEQIIRDRARRDLDSDHGANILSDLLLESGPEKAARALASADLLFAQKLYELLAAEIRRAQELVIENGLKAFEEEGR